jgi:hypothetical protein
VISEKRKGEKRERVRGGEKKREKRKEKVKEKER